MISLTLKRAFSQPAMPPHKPPASAPATKVNGIEVEATLVPVDNLRLNGTLTVTDGSYRVNARKHFASGAPIGDLAVQLGDAFLGGNGFAFMLVIAASVAIAILGTTLAAMNSHQDPLDTLSNAECRR